MYLAHVIEQPDFRIPNPKYLQRNFCFDFLMILRTHFEASLRFRKNWKKLRDFNLQIAECLALLFDQASKQNIGDSEFGNLVVR